MLVRGDDAAALKAHALESKKAQCREISFACCSITITTVIPLDHTEVNKHDLVLHVRKARINSLIELVVGQSLAIVDGSYGG